MELEALVLTSSAACLACWAVELWKLGPVVVVVVAERGGSITANLVQSQSSTIHSSIAQV